MGRLVFSAAAVRRVIVHTLNATQHQPHVIGYRNNGEAETEPGKPAVVLVHDDGVYLMSNGLPRDLVNPTDKSRNARSFVVHAKGCDPARDPDFWERSRALVGGDDFAETLPWAEEIRDMIQAGARHIVFEVSDGEIELLHQVGEDK